MSDDFSKSISDASEVTEPQVLLIDKPSGMTSHDVVNFIRRKTGIKRVGHAGTLDPLATGLLIVLVGRGATKRQSEFLKVDKEYECTAEFGFETDTYDGDGEIVARANPDDLDQLTETNVKSAMTQFIGEIQQTVPAYSAVKIHGKKLYEKARRNEIAQEELPSRVVKIHSFELLEFHKDDKKITASFKIYCSSGTYIRSLIYDLGKAVGVGATVMKLRRTMIADLSVRDAISLDIFRK